MVAVLGTGKFLEAVFARFLLHDGRGPVVVYSKRIYGARVGDEMSKWLGENGRGVERAAKLEPDPLAGVAAGPASGRRLT